MIKDLEAVIGYNGVISNAFTQPPCPKRTVPDKKPLPNGAKSKV